MIFSITVIIGASTQFTVIRTGNAYGCLSFDTANQHYLLDARTGDYFSRPIVDSRSPDLYSEGESLDKRYKVQLRYEDTQRDLHLLLIPKDSDTPVFEHTYSPKTPFPEQALQWSPDGSRLLFNWVDNGNEDHIELVNLADISVQHLDDSTTPIYLRGWSADSKYFAAQFYDPNGDFKVWQVGIPVPILAVTGTSINSILTRDLHPFWMGNQNKITYLEQANNDISLNIFSPDEVDAKRMITFKHTMSADFFIHDVNMSSDGYYLKMITEDSATISLDVFGINGEAKHVDQTATNPLIDSFWPQNGHTLIFSHRYQSGMSDVYIYHPDTRITEQIAQKAELRQDYGKLTLMWQDRDDVVKTHIEIRDSDGSNPIRVLDDANWITSKQWLSNGTLLIVANYTSSGATVSRLIWYDLNTGKRGELQQDFPQIDNFTEANSPQKIAFTVHWDDGTSSLELLDLTTSDYKTLLRDYQRIIIAGGDQASAFRVWWSKDGQNALDGYNTDGQRVYQAKLASFLPGKTVWSPDKQRLVISDDGVENGLQMASPDGTWNHVVQAEPSTNAYGLWSPDSALLAESGDWQTLPLSIVTPDGVIIGRYPQFHEALANMEWTQCKTR